MSANRARYFPTAGKVQLLYIGQFYQAFLKWSLPAMNSPPDNGRTIIHTPVFEDCMGHLSLKYESLPSRVLPDKIKAVPRSPYRLHYLSSF